MGYGGDDNRREQQSDGQPLREGGLLLLLVETPVPLGLADSLTRLGKHRPPRPGGSAATPFSLS
jgi:hypothetical protein